ncbi:hypothetical protein KAU37_08070, partial [Candidatus Bipolaricaulota bacterium]|nr:hypothetical protein [Candidatus Bipolaricaulota bacterium]
GCMILAVFVASLLTAGMGALLLIPRLHRTGIVGRDMHKLGKPEVAEMGGLRSHLWAGYISGSSIPCSWCLPV